MYHNEHEHSTHALNVSHHIHKSLVPQEMLALIKDILVELIQNQFECVTQCEASPCEPHDLVLFGLREPRTSTDVGILGFLSGPQLFLGLRHFQYEFPQGLKPIRIGQREDVPEDH